MALPQPPTPPLDLAERIRILQSDIKILVENAAAIEAANAGGSVPAVVIERQIWQRAGFCACRAFDEVKQ